MRLDFAVAAINAAAATWVAGYVLYAVWVGLRARSRTAAQALVGEGALWALDFMIAGTLLRSLQLKSWSDIGIFAATLALRTMVNRVFARERDMWRARAH